MALLENGTSQNWVSEHPGFQTDIRVHVKISGRGASPLELVIPFVQKVHTAKACVDAAPICKFFLAGDGLASWAKSTLQTGHTNKQRDVLSCPQKPRNSNSVCKWTQASLTHPYKIQRLYKEKLPDISWCNTNSPQVKNKKLGCCDISVEAWLDMSCTTLPIPTKS